MKAIKIFFTLTIIVVIVFCNFYFIKSDFNFSQHRLLDLLTNTAMADENGLAIWDVPDTKNEHVKLEETHCDRKCIVEYYYAEVNCQGTGGYTCEDSWECCNWKTDCCDLENPCE